MINDDLSLNVLSSDSLHFIGELKSDEIASAIPNGYLMNLTKVIGKQTSFYEEGGRQRRVYISTSKVYEHKIQFVIPQGYTLENIKNFEFNKEYVTSVDGSDKVIASFKSEARIDGNMLTIDVYEFYEEGLYPKEDLDVYREVINAAYEFYISNVRLVRNPG